MTSCSIVVMIAEIIQCIKFKCEIEVYQVCGARYSSSQLYRCRTTYFSMCVYVYFSHQYFNNIHKSHYTEPECSKYTCNNQTGIFLL